MAFIDVPPYIWPLPVNQAAVAPNFTATGSMNASGDRIAFVVQCPKAGTLDKFEFRVSAMANNPDNGIRLSFQTIDAATGSPDNTPDQYRDYVTALSAGLWVTPGLMTDDGTDTGVKRTVTRGERIGCVIDFVSFVASDSFSVSMLRTDTLSMGAIAYSADGSAGTYTKGSVSNVPILALKYDDGTYASFAPDMACPISAINTYTINNASTPDEVGMKFQFDAPVRARGAWVFIDLDNDCEIVLYDSGGSALQTVTVDKDIRHSSGTTIMPYFVFFTTSEELTENADYRLVFKAGASNCSVYGFECPGSAYLAAMPQGANSVLTSRTNAGAWTDTTDEQFLGGLIIDGIDDGTGGASSTGGSFTFVG